MSDIHDRTTRPAAHADQPPPHPERSATGDRAGLDARRLVWSTTRYEDAQRTVDALSDDGFPVEHLTIVASDLRLVEHVTGRRTTVTAALQGAASGAVMGLLIGALLGSFAFVDPLQTLWVTALLGLVIGALIGAVLGALGHAMRAGRRDFDTVSSLDADRYEILADANVAERAREQAARLADQRS